MRKSKVNVERKLKRSLARKFRKILKIKQAIEY